MITCWTTVVQGRERTLLEADAHGRRLQVERRRGDRTWHWIVRSGHGRELASGVAPDRERAESAAEDEAYRVHPPVGDVVEWWSS